MGNHVVILTRHSVNQGDVFWDGVELGSWTAEIEGADVVLNLAGRSVNCLYNQTNLRQMMDSRVQATRAVGQAIAQAKEPPKLWLQMSTATIYAHRYDAPNDALTGTLGGNEPNSPPKWVSSIKIAKGWEAALNEAETPRTRKVALRTAMVMGPEPGGVFQTMANLARGGLAGTASKGNQFISWIHEVDFARSLDFIIADTSLDGVINIASPNPLPNKEFNLILRRALGVKIGFPAARWMLELGALAMKTETELILKSRRVVPTRLLNAGFQFTYQTWQEAVKQLAMDSYPDR